MRSFATTNVLHIDAHKVGWSAAIIPTDPTGMLALFPKSVGLKLSTCDKVNGVTVPWISGHANFRANGVNGGVNEAGVKRFKSLIKAANKAGIEIVMNPSFVGSYATLAEALHQFIEIS